MILKLKKKKIIRLFHLVNSGGFPHIVSIYNLGVTSIKYSIRKINIERNLHM